MTKYKIIKGHNAYHILRENTYSFLFWDWKAWGPVEKFSGVGNIMETRWFNTFGEANKHVKHLHRVERKGSKEPQNEY